MTKQKNWVWIELEKQDTACYDFEKEIAEWRYIENEHETEPLEGCSTST